MSEDAPFEGFSSKKGEKTGGIHASDREGGIYESLDGNNTYLIKRDVSKLHNDIAEFMAAQLFDELCPGSACEISLHQSIETGRTFLASKFFKADYRDLFSDLGKKTRSANLETAQAWMPGNQQYVRKGLSGKTQGEFNYQNYERATAASLLLGDKSVHSGNIGVLDRNGQKELVRIDFGAAFRELSPEINPKKSVKNRLGLEKNYFLRDHPTKRTYTKEFSDELKREAAIDLGPRIEQAWHQIVQNYDNELERDAILRFAKQIGVPEESLAIENPAIQLEAIHDFFAKRMQERQQSQLDMALEIDLKLAINKDKSIDIEKLQAAIAENPKHAEFIVNNPSKLQLKFKLSKKQQAVLSNEVENYKQRLASQELAPQATVTAEQAHDRVVLAPKTKTTPVKRTAEQATSINLNEAVDPITLAIREEIISAQQSLLQKEISRTMQGAEQQAFAEQDLSEVQTYLKSEEGQASVAKIMKNPIVQTQMHEIESAGYNAVHNKFKDNFRNIEWAPVADSTTRSTEITNDSGQSICTLKETTVKTQATAFTLSDETTKNVSAYRHIDFPKKLNNNNGPMHLSMAVKDANGNNIAEKDAVYFTAHYDDSGKLTEVSSPIPVKFMGSADDAIGYIERNGEIYTLPVTQGKYHEMMQEVAKNNGMNVDLSQAATITVSAQPKTQTQTVEHNSEEVEQQTQLTPEQPAAKQIQTPTPVLEEVSTQPLKAAAIKDLHKLRGYFDDTLSKMKIEALENGVEFDAEKYNALTQQWHELCDNSIELLNTSNKDLTQEQLKAINSATIIMAKSVSPQFSAVFLEDQEHYLQRWGELIPKKGAALIDVSQNIVTQHATETTLEQYLETEQTEISGLNKQAKTARLHALATELEGTYPEFAVVTNKLEKGKNKKKGTYDIKLDNETYLELYETCRKVELGLTSPEDAALTIRNTLNEQLSTRRKISSFLSRKPKQQPQVQEAEQAPTEELDILKDLKLFRGYFEKTLTLMQANAEKNDIPFDIRKYDEAVQKWHELCDQTIESVTATSKYLTQEQIDAISTARAHMAKPVNPEFVKIFIKKPDYYLERWSEVLAEKGNVLLKISKDIEKEITLQHQQIPSEREAVNELDGQTRTAKLHNMVQGLMAEHPELAPIDKKLLKGRNNKGTYDIKLDTETYLELYKACKKIELGIASDIDHEVTNIRSILNQNLSLSRRFKNRNNSKSTQQTTQLPEEVQVDTPPEQLSASNSTARELASKWRSVTATIPVSHPTSEEQKALHAEPKFTTQN